jgi:hypothetical protein
MTYKVISRREVCGKKQGEILTLKELQNAGANIEALIASGHIQAGQASPVSPVSPVSPAVQKPIKPAIQEGANN